MIVYAENMKELKKYLEVINNYSKIVGYNTNTQKLINSLYASN